MPDITFTADTLRYISLFENITKTRVKDCLETEDKLVFAEPAKYVGQGKGKWLKADGTTRDGGKF